MNSTHTDTDQQTLTRKQRRGHAREQRKAMEKALVTSAARRTRLTQLAIVATVIVIGIVGVLVASGGGGGAAGGGSPGNAKTVDGDVSRLLAGIPQSGNVLGAPTAPVTLQYFGDLECPVCRAFTLSAGARRQAADRIPLTGDGHP
jgi:protein-disulfide isomerase